MSTLLRIKRTSASNRAPAARKVSKVTVPEAADLRTKVNSKGGPSAMLEVSLKFMVSFLKPRKRSSIIFKKSGGPRLESRVDVFGNYLETMIAQEGLPNVRMRSVFSKILRLLLAASKANSKCQCTKVPTFSSLTVGGK